MRLAVLSDTHDNIWNLEEALRQSADADALIHCGDLCSPFMIDRLGRMVAGQAAHVVWGNNEGDIRLMCQIAARYEHVHLHGALAELTIDGLRVAVNHYPQIAKPLATSGQYDLVCYGHDHTKHASQVSDCTLLNPGELMGLNGPATYAWFDTQTRQVEFVEIK